MSLIREIFVPGIIVVFGLVYYLSVHDLPRHSTLFPYFLMIVMPLLIVMIFIQEYRERKPRGEEPDYPQNAVKTTLMEFKAPAVIFAGSIGYLLVFSLAGFLVASPLFVFFIMVYFRINPVRSAITSVVFTATLYVVFGKMFLVDL